MMMKLKIIIFLAVILLSFPVMAKKNQAKQARDKNLAAVTIFVDISAFGRKDRSAKRMTELHQNFAEYNYKLIGVAPYTENGDLEGFFVSYVSTLKL